MAETINYLSEVEIQDNSVVKTYKIKDSQARTLISQKQDKLTNESIIKAIKQTDIDKWNTQSTLNISYNTAGDVVISM